MYFITRKMEPDTPHHTHPTPHPQNTIFVLFKFSCTGLRRHKAGNPIGIVVAFLAFTDTVIDLLLPGGI